MAREISHEREAALFQVVSRINHNHRHDSEALRMALLVHDLREPLNLERLAGFPSFDFAHDVYGIAQNLDRLTGRLLNCFVPRCGHETVAEPMTYPAAAACPGCSDYTGSGELCEACKTVPVDPDHSPEAEAEARQIARNITFEGYLA